jgi:ABC-2 type transport system permease protein
MSTATLEQPRPIDAAGVSAAGGSQLGWLVSDTWELIRRNFRHILRNPELLLDVTVQPILFVLLFRYVFGGAIETEGTSYVNYLMAGIFVFTLSFAMIFSGVLLANDLKNGIIERFRSLPMAAWTVLVARTITDLVRSVLAMMIMIAVGLLIGFRPDGTVLEWLGALGVLLLFGFALAWVGISLGLAVRTPEAASGAIFVFMFPLTFASSAFVPTDTMPSWLKPFTENQPITVVMNTVRAWILGKDPGSDAWQSILWSLGILVLFFPVAMYLYRKRTSE